MSMMVWLLFPGTYPQRRVVQVGPSTVVVGD
jgi:hypothetical protein